MQHVFIVGSKGIPANYGGYETFVDKLTEYQVSDSIQYYVACAVDDKSQLGDFECHGAYCFNVLRKPIGAAKAIFYDVDAVRWCINYVKKNNIKKFVVYVLACRIGPFFGDLVRQIHELGGLIFVNPDGHEWKRAKWSAPVKKYWKTSESSMVKHADLLVCDSTNIEGYIRSEYVRFDPKTTYIAYGADVERSVLPDDDKKIISWFSENELQPYGYYLVVGRFVPENNYETMIREFMSSSSSRDLVLVTGIESGFLKNLKHKTGFDKDPRIKFVGTIYDAELLKKIREWAFGYLHGHEVGGTNPSLLEALSSTRLNLLLDVGFNKEVARDSAFYWSKEEGSLEATIEYVEGLGPDMIALYDEKSTSEIRLRYQWKDVVSSYEALFLEGTCELDGKNNLD